MDADLLEAFLRGDRDGLTRVYRLHVRQVEDRVRYMLMRTGQLTRADLADLVQEVFLHAFSNAARARYDGRRDYGPFLLTVASNLVIDWVRRRYRERLPADLLAELNHDPGTAQALDPTAPYDISLVSLTEAYVATLPPDLRRIHHYRFALSMPQRDAASALGITRQSLRTLEKKLLTGLRLHLRRAQLRGHAVATTEFPVRPKVPLLEERMVANARRR